MRVSHIKIQQNIITLNGKKDEEEIEKEISCRNNSNVNHISIFNSKINVNMFPKLPENIEILTIRKSIIENQINAFVFGPNLKVIELPNCLLAKIPIIQSKLLTKLNVSHNNISQLLQIPNSSALRILDMRNNRLTILTKKIHSFPKLQIFHEFLPASMIQMNSQLIPNEEDEYIYVEDQLGELIYTWNNVKIIETCQQIIENNNSFMLNQLIPYLDDNFIEKIFEIAVKKKKQNILQSIVKLNKIKLLTLEDRFMLLMPELLPYDIIKVTPLQLIIKSLFDSNSQRPKIQHFLSYLELICKENKFLLIESEKDFINYMNLTVKYPHNFETEFLLTQTAFFQTYEFTNDSIIKYLLHLDCIKMVKIMLLQQTFKEKIFAIASFKKMLKPNKKIYKILYKEKKKYFRQVKQNNNNWFYPQYRQRKSFCLKNDLYDYEMLQEYEQMQCSYLQKNFKYTIKFYNKQNQISIARRIGNELKKNTLKNFRSNVGHYEAAPTFKL